MADNNNNNNEVNPPKNKEKEGKLHEQQSEMNEVVSQNYEKEPTLSGDMKNGGMNSDSPSFAVANNTPKTKEEEENDGGMDAGQNVKDKPKVEKPSGGKVEVPKTDVVPEIEGKKPLDAAEGKKPLDAAEGKKPLDAAEGKKPLDVAEGKKPLDAAEGKKPLDAAEGKKPLDAAEGNSEDSNSGAKTEEQKQEKREEEAKSLIESFVEKEKGVEDKKGKKKEGEGEEVEVEDKDAQKVEAEAGGDVADDPKDDKKKEEGKKKLKTDKGAEGLKDEANTEEQQAADDTEADLDRQIAEKEAAQDAVRNEATKMGTMVGRSMGYGQRLKVINTAKPKEGAAAGNSKKQEGDSEEKEDTSKSYIEKTPFFPAEEMEALRKEQGLELNTYAYEKLKEEKERAPKKAYQTEEQEKAEAISKQEGKQEYYSFYISAYNQGYNQGLQFKKQEKIDNFKKAEAEREKDPNYKLGKELGMYAGTLSVKGEKEFKLKLDKDHDYDKTFSEVHTNAMAGKDPDGKEQSENFKKGYLKYYNVSYAKANKAKKKGPSHEDRLKDPEFKTGYLDGNTLARNENLDAAKKEKLNKIKSDHFSAAGIAKSKSDENYKKQRAGFIYGYNAAHHQQAAEKKAKEKALLERKKSDPVYSLGQAAGTMKGLIASVSSMGKVKSIAATKVTEQGLDLTIPDNVVKVLKTDAYPTSEPLYANPDKVTDAKEKEALKAKREEQIVFFKEAYLSATNRAYNNGVKNRGNLEFNKLKQTEGYKKAMKVVYTGEEKSHDEDKKPIKLNLNLGALVAYAKHKCRYLKDGDKKKSLLEAEIVNAEALNQREDADFQSAYRSAYNFFYGKLSNPKNPIAQKMRHKSDIASYSGETDDEKTYFAYGKQLAQIKIKKDEKVKKAREAGIDSSKFVAESNDLLAKVRLDVERKIVKDIAPDHKISGADSQELRASATKVLSAPQKDETKAKENKALLAKITRALSLLTNGFNRAVYDSQPKEVKKGNVKEEIDKKIGEVVKDLSGEAKEEAEKLFRAAADEGFILAYNEVKAYMKTATSFEIDKIKQGIVSKLDKRVEKKKKEIEKGQFKDKVNQLVAIYKEGFNRDLKQFGDQFGVLQGLKDGQHYAAGYAPNLKDWEDKYTNENHEAYKEGVAVAAKEKGYGEFAAMMDVDAKKKIEEKEAAYGDITGDENRAAFDLGNTRDVAAWTKLFLLKMSQVVPEEVEKNVEPIKIEKDEELEVDAKLLEENKVSVLVEKVVAGYKEKTEQDVLDAFDKQNSDKEDAKKKPSAIEMAELDERVILLSMAFDKGYSLAVEKAERDVIKSKDENILYALGYRDAFIRINGEENLPQQLLVADGKLEEVLANQDFKEEHYTQEAKYIEGATKGGELAVQIKSGVISADKVDAAIAKDTEGKVKNDYAAGLVAGKKEGEKHAKSLEHGTEVPDAKAVLNKAVLKENKAIDESKEGDTSSWGTGKKEIKDPSDLYLKGFEKSYWMERDRHAGKIEGVKAIMANKDTSDISAYYKVVADGETLSDGKRAIKNPEVFEMAFFLATEAARSSRDGAKELLGKLTEKDKEDQTDEEKLVSFIKGIEKTALDLAKAKSLQHAAYRAAGEMGVLEQIQKLDALKAKKEGVEKEIELLKKQDEETQQQQQLYIAEQRLEKLTKAEGKHGSLREKFVDKDEEDGSILSSPEEGMEAADSYMPNNTAGIGKLSELLGLGSDDDTIKDFTEEQKQSIYDLYSSTYEEQKEVAYNHCLTEFSALFAFGVGMADVTEALDDNVVSSSGGENSSDEEKIGDAIEKLLETNTNDAVLSNMAIMNVFDEQEQLLQMMNVQIEKDRKEAYSYDFDIWDLEDEKEEKEDHFGMTEEVLKEEIAALEKKKEEEGPLTIKESTRLGTYRTRMKKFEKINEKIKELETSSLEAYEKIEVSTEEIRQFLRSKLKLDVPKADNDEILDYVDYFDKKLNLTAGFAYSSSNVTITGTGQYQVFENAEDVEIHANVDIDKDDYAFSSTGFRYIEDKNHMTLFAGTAVIPRLEGDQSADMMQEYTFSDIGIDLSRGLRGQLDQQSNKLVGGPIYKSTGNRKNKTDSKYLDSDGEQNIVDERPKK